MLLPRVVYLYNPLRVSHFTPHRDPVVAVADGPAPLFRQLIPITGILNGSPYNNYSSLLTCLLTDSKGGCSCLISWHTRVLPLKSVKPSKFNVSVLLRCTNNKVKLLTGKNMFKSAPNCEDVSMTSRNISTVTMYVTFLLTKSVVGNRHNSTDSHRCRSIGSASCRRCHRSALLVVHVDVEHHFLEGNRHWQPTEDHRQIITKSKKPHGERVHKPAYSI